MAEDADNTVWLFVYSAAKFSFIPQFSLGPDYMLNTTPIILNSLQLLTDLPTATAQAI